MSDFIENALMFMIGNIIMPIFVVGIAVFLLALPFLGYSFYKEMKSPVLQLKKDQWTCAAYHDYTTTTYTWVGKVMIPIVVNNHECVNWVHI